LLFSVEVLLVSTIPCCWILVNVHLNPLFDMHVQHMLVSQQYNKHTVPAVPHAVTLQHARLHLCVSFCNTRICVLMSSTICTTQL
jgi:hypothetical protein